MPRLFNLLVVALVAMFSASPASAQDFPSKPISLVTPYPVGGPYDMMARQIAEQIRVKLGKAIVVEPKVGGAALIATRYVKQAPADGHTLLLQTGAMALNTLLFKDAGYTMDDFVPLSPVATNPYVLFVNDKVPASNLKELMAYAKVQQDKLNIGDFGSLGTVQLLIDQMSEAGGLKLTQIPYKGGNDMTSGLVANDIQLMFAGIGPAVPFVESGKLKAIAIAQDERTRLMPQVPTFGEAGMPMVSVTSYVAVFARAGTPEPVLRRLREIIAEVVRSKEFHDRVTPLGVDPWTIDPSQLAAFVDKDFALWKSRPITSRPYDK